MARTKNTVAPAKPAGAAKRGPGRPPKAGGSAASAKVAPRKVSKPVKAKPSKKGSRGVKAAKSKETSGGLPKLPVSPAEELWRCDRNWAGLDRAHALLRCALYSRALSRSHAAFLRSQALARPDTLHGALDEGGAARQAVCDVAKQADGVCAQGQPRVRCVACLVRSTVGGTVGRATTSRRLSV